MAFRISGSTFTNAPSPVDPNAFLFSNAKAEWRAGMILDDGTTNLVEWEVWESTSTVNDQRAIQGNGHPGSYQFTVPVTFSGTFAWDGILAPTDEDRAAILDFTAIGPSSGSDYAQPYRANVPNCRSPVPPE